MTFLDTSFLGALFMKNDQWHEAAHAWAGRAVPPLITTDYVLIELADGLARPQWRSTFARIRSSLHDNSDVRIVSQSPALFDRGVELYNSRPDKAWTLTDCLSFVVMREAECMNALTADAHFEQAGFVALLRQQPT